MGYEPAIEIYLIENEWIDFDANWHKWSTGQSHETVNFLDQPTRRSKVKITRGRR